MNSKRNADKEVRLEAIPAGVKLKDLRSKRAPRKKIAPLAGLWRGIAGVLAALLVPRSAPWQSGPAFSGKRRMRRTAPLHIARVIPFPEQRRRRDA